MIAIEILTRSGNVVDHIDIILTDDGMWQTGQTVEVKTGFIQKWIRMNNSEYQQRYGKWFEIPYMYFRKYRNKIISTDTSDAISDIFQGMEATFFELSEKVEDQHLDDLIKLFLGPVAVYLKTRIVGTRNIASLLPVHVWVDVVSRGIKYNIQRQVVTDLLDNPKQLVSDLITKYDYVEADTSIVNAALLQIISDNPDQWAQTKVKPSMKNWFVGQFMKTNKGVDASVVKAELDKIYDQGN